MLSPKACTDTLGKVLGSGPCDKACCYWGGKGTVQQAKYCGGKSAAYPPAYCDEICCTKANATPQARSWASCIDSKYGMGGKPSDKAFKCSLCKGKGPNGGKWVGCMPTCGNGKVDDNGEECEKSSDCKGGSCDKCECKVVCGDGLVGGGEGCDKGYKGPAGCNACSGGGCQICQNCSLYTPQTHAWECSKDGKKGTCFGGTLKQGQVKFHQVPMSGKECGGCAWSGSNSGPGGVYIGRPDPMAFNHGLNVGGYSLSKGGSTGPHKVGTFTQTCPDKALVQTFRAWAPDKGGASYQICVWCAFAP